MAPPESSDRIGDNIPPPPASQLQAAKPPIFKSCGENITTGGVKITRDYRNPIAAWLGLLHARVHEHRQ